MSGEAGRILEEYARRERETPPDRYALTDPAALFIHQELERASIEALRGAGKLPLAGRRILDAGCGHGAWLDSLERWGAERALLAGVDLVPARAEGAAARLPGADVRTGDASRLPWDDATFDVVLQSMMFSSVLDAGMRRRIAAEMTRVLRPGGVVLWYDFFVSHPRNAHVRGVRRGEIEALFGGFDVRLRRLTPAPPLLRRVARRARPLASALAAVRVLDTHYLGTLRRP